MSTHCLLGAHQRGNGKVARFIIIVSLLTCQIRQLVKRTQAKYTAPVLIIISNTELSPIKECTQIAEFMMRMEPFIAP